MFDFAADSGGETSGVLASAGGLPLSTVHIKDTFKKQQFPEVRAERATIGGSLGPEPARHLWMD
jgi:hypothetical protein